MIWIFIQKCYPLIFFIELVEDLLVKMDKTTAGIQNETKEVVQILKKDSTRGKYCRYYLKEHKIQKKK